MVLLLAVAVVHPASSAERDAFDERFGRWLSNDEDEWAEDSQVTIATPNPATKTQAGLSAGSSRASQPVVQKPPANPFPHGIPQLVVQKPPPGLNKAQFLKPPAEDEKPHQEPAMKLSRLCEDPWYHSEVEYIKLEGLILLLFAVAAIFYELTFLLLKDQLAKYAQSCKPDDVRTQYEMTELAKIDDPGPKGAYLLQSALLSCFTHTVTVLCCVAFTFYCANKAGIDVHFAAYIRKKMQIEICLEDLGRLICDVWMQLFVATVLLFLMTATTIALVLNKQINLRNGHKSAAQLEADPGTEEKLSEVERVQANNYLNLRDYLYTVSSDDKSALYVAGITKTFDLSRYLAVGLDTLVGLLSFFQLSSWTVFLLFELLIWSVATMGERLPDRLVLVLIALSGFMPSLVLLAWVTCTERCFSVLPGAVFRDKLSNIDPDNQTAPSIDPAKKGSSSWMLTCCLGVRGIMALLQAASFLTCYAVARWIAAERAYNWGWEGKKDTITHGWKVPFSIALFVLLYALQVLFQSGVVISCGTILYLPPGMTKQNVHQVKLIVDYSASIEPEGSNQIATDP